MAFLLAVVPCRAQQPSTSTNSNSQTDVFLFIHPTSPTTARIGLSYRKRVPHGQVEKEIKKLLAISGWQLSAQPSISDETMRPDDPKRFPPKTGAEFEVAVAPQFHDNAPILAPYLKAFHAWDHLDILLMTPDLVPYNGVTNFRSPALDVTLAKSEGVYEYRVTIREHSADLPALIPDRPGSAGPNGGTQNPPGSAAQAAHSAGAPTGSVNASSFCPYALIAVGAMLAGGVGLFLAAKRHQENLKPRRLR